MTNSSHDEKTRHDFYAIGLLKISRRELDEELEKQKAMMNWQLAKESDSEMDSDDELDEALDLSK